MNKNDGGVAPTFNRLWRWESIDGDGACDPYMYRLTLLKLLGGRRLYLHHFVGDDWSRDPHDHPKAFTSIGLRGSYIEEVYARPDRGCELVKTERTYTAPWIRRFRPEHIHRIRATSCWTLVYVGPTKRDWGFWHKARTWMQFREYLDRIGSSRKDC